MITKYGYFTVGVSVFTSFLIITGGILLNSNYLKIPLIAIGVLLLIFTLNFFRDPERTAPDSEDVIISPADGVVLLVKTTEELNYLKSEGSQISIFMSPLNVHVNRIPINGKVEYLEYVKGKYLVADHDKASQKNERMEIGIGSKHGKIFFTQVAGYIARRIVCELTIGDSVKMGDRFGMIKFGSRVDVIAPGNWKPVVKSGDKVKAGETILFELN